MQWLRKDGIELSYSEVYHWSDDYDTWEDWKASCHKKPLTQSVLFVIFIIVWLAL